VGANIGYYCVHVANETSVSRLNAFEPDPRNFDQLHANLFLNALSTRVDSYCAAVSNEAGKLTFEAFPDTSTGQSRIVESGGGKEVDAVRLDDVLVLEDTNLAIKIDIEGHEAAAIAGMPKLLTANRCIIQVEVYPPKLEQFRAIVTGLGYREIYVVGHDHYFTNFAAAL
jgi:FkbM family methyltransferase